MRRELAQKWVDVFCRFWHLSSNGVTAKTVLCDLDLLFKGQQFKMLISLKRWELAENEQNDFYRFGYLQTNDIIAKFTSNDLDILFEVKKFEMLLSRKQS